MGLLCLLLLMLIGPSAVQADVVLDWNNELLNAIKTTKTSPPQAARAMAMTQLAVYNAVNAVDRAYQPYGSFNTPAPLGASRESAAVEAAYSVLNALFPTQSAALVAARSNSLLAIANGPAKDQGIDLGQAAASHMLALRANDGSSDTVAYTPSSDPGRWRPTPPGFQPALLPQWAGVTPFAMTYAGQFQTAGPPALDSDEYSAAVNNVKNLGAATGSTRTAEQTQIAYFWADGAGTVTPPGHWNQIAQSVAEDKHLSLSENARLFALLGMAVADAGISAWDNKYAFDFWRPITAIREAEFDGNPDTLDDDSWTPLLVTPPFPECTSGHSTFSGASAEILSSLFGDDVSFSTQGPINADGTIGQRFFDSFSAAAIEAGNSRIYGGIHFDFSNGSGVDAGQDLADYIVANFLTPAPEPTSLGLLMAAGLIRLSRRPR